MLGWDKSSSLTFRLKEKGAFGRCDGKEKIFSIPFPLSCLTNVQDFCKPEHFSLALTTKLGCLL